MPYSKIILNTEQLNRIVLSLAQKISSDFHHKEPCLALVVLEGARYFANDLLKQIIVPIDIEYITANSYSGVNSTGNVVVDIKDSLEEKIRGKNILLIDDIYDTGNTLSRILQWLNACQPKNVRTCVLLEKQHSHTRDIKIDYIGTQVKDSFVIGYGLDYNGQYRDLPFIGVLSEELIR